MEHIQLDKPETWVNHPAPVLPDWMHAELLKIGGTNDYGQPNLCFAWGQERLAFRINRMRLLYIDMRIPAIERHRYTFKKLLYVHTERVHLGTNQETGEMQFEEREIPKYETFVLDHPPGPGDIIPPGFIYDQEYPELEWIGQQNFFIEQFIPPDHILGGPEAWERERYDIGINPDTGVEETLDFLGEWPAEGRYETAHLIGQPCEYLEWIQEPVVRQHGWQQVTRRLPDGRVGTVTEPKLVYTGEFNNVPKIRQGVAYIEPTEETLAEIREAWSRRNNEETVDPGKRSGLRFYEYNHRMQKQVSAQKEENRKGLADALSAHLAIKCGNRSYSSNVNAMVEPPTTNLNRKDRRRSEALKRRKKAA